ncbi:MAG: rod shape-determining protein MreD [Prevotella sp.]|nr:rod shape-determining protein MreD [Prevotella sp.]
MSIDFLKRLSWFGAFLLAQVLVLGQIHLFHYATPLLYVYFVTQFPRNHAKWAILLWSFMMGLLVDTFFNTPGVAAASLTLIGAIQPYYFELFVPRDSAEDLMPSLRNISPTKYAYYIVPLVSLYCMLFFSLEMFTFFNWLQWLLCVVSSALVTLLLIFTFEVAKK